MRTVTLATGTKAVYVAATTTKVYVTLDGSTPSSTNGIPIVAGGLPVYLSVGSPVIKWIGSASATHVVDVLCLT